MNRADSRAFRTAFAITSPSSRDLPGMRMANSSPPVRATVASAGAAVGEIDENLHTLGNDVVRFLAVDIHHEADTAGVALVERTIKTLRLREATNHLEFFLGGVGHELQTSTDDSI